MFSHCSPKSWACSINITHHTHRNTYTSYYHVSLPILGDFHIPSPENMFAAHIKDQNRGCQVNVDHAEMCVSVGIVIVVVSQSTSYTQGHLKSITTSTCDIRKSRSLKYNRGRGWGGERNRERGSGETDRGEEDQAGVSSPWCVEECL